MATTIKVDYYKDVQKSLRAANPALQKQVAKQLRAQVQVVVQEARAAASWSQTIPPAIGATVSVTGAGIRVSRRKSMIAVLNEYGPWRHPLFGNRDYWYPQAARPSVRPVVAANRERIRHAAIVAAHEALKEAGF